MLEKYPVKIAPRTKELKSVPSDMTLFAILNYSKSVTSKVVRNKKVLFHLN